MSTHSAIIVKIGKKYKGIYCQWDGDTVGETLKKNFNNYKDAKAIIELGNCSRIAECERINPIGKHSFDKPEDGTIVAYHRDRGELKKETKAFIGDTWQEVAKAIDMDFIYVFENGEWVKKELGHLYYQYGIN